VLLGKVLPVLIVLTIIFHAAPYAYAAAGMETTSYRLLLDGSAIITVVVTPPSNEDVIAVPLEKEYVDGSVVAFSKEGVPLIVNTSDGMAYVDVYNTTELVIITYEAVLGNVSDEGIIKVQINPLSKAVVYLPQDTALISASGNPDISAENDTILLVYASGGNYTIELFMIPPVTTSGITTPPISPTPPPGGGEDWTFRGLLIGGIMAVVLAAALLLYRRRKVGKVVELEMLEGLDDRDLSIIRALKDREMSLSDISRALGLNKSVVWRRVKRLTQLGYLEKKMVKGKTIYTLTGKGREVLGRS